MAPPTNLWRLSKEKEGTWAWDDGHLDMLELVLETFTDGVGELFEGRHVETERGGEVVRAVGVDRETASASHLLSTFGFYKRLSLVSTRRLV